MVNLLSLISLFIPVFVSELFYGIQVVNTSPFEYLGILFNFGNLMSSSSGGLSSVIQAIFLTPPLISIFFLVRAITKINKNTHSSLVNSIITTINLAGFDVAMMIMAMSSGYSFPVAMLIFVILQVIGIGFIGGVALKSFKSEKKTKKAAAKETAEKKLSFPTPTPTQAEYPEQYRTYTLNSNEAKAESINQELQFCDECGAKHEANKKFCSKCGTKLN